MSLTFEPRSAGPGAWKGWHKDAARLVGRVGIVTAGLWCVLLVGALAGLAALTDQSGLAFLMAMVGVQLLGTLLEPVMQAALTQAADGQRVSLFSAFRTAVAEWKDGSGWLLPRLRNQIVANLVVIMLALLVMYAWQPAAPESSAANTDPNEWGTTFILLIFCVITPTSLRQNGIMDFRYWLVGKYGMSKVLSQGYHLRAQMNNLKSFLCAALSLVGMYLVVGLAPWTVVALVGLPILQWYQAAYLRCAYHDIFEGGTGLKEKVTAPVHSDGAVPVLQA